jgi:pimeloyl-ACP methyl ester carboxylesterase
MAGPLDKEKVRTVLLRTATRTLDGLSDFRVPTLLVAGGQDVVFPSFLAANIAAKLPCADAQLMPDSGHSPYFEQAATFNRLVEAFLSLHR